MSEIDNLSLLNEMIKDSVNQLESQLTQMTGIKTNTKISRVSLMDIEHISNNFDSDKRISSFIKLTGGLNGFLVVLLSPKSAKKVADSMMENMGMQSDSKGFGELEKSALKEIGNILTSGFVDGMANSATCEINSSPPYLSAGKGDKAIGPILDFLEKRTDIVVTMDSKLETPHEGLDYKVFLFTDPDNLKKFLNNVKK